MSRKKEQLTALEERAAFMKARGFTHPEIAKELGRSLPWVSKLPSSPLFSKKVAEFEQQIRDELKNQSENGLPEIERFKDQISQSSKEIHATGMELLAKVKAAIALLDSEDISISKLPSMLKAASDAVACATTMQKEALGIDTLIEEIQEVQKLSGLNQQQKG